MYEPKYKLNKRDDVRWRALLLRHCFDCPGHKRRFIRKYPPLTPEENAEFEALCRKRSKKIEAHPKVKASIARLKRHDRKIERLSVKLKALNKKLNRNKVKITVDGKM